jgi:hypothetical protein
MKTVKNIFISLFLTFGVLCYFGHGFVDYYGHVKSDIENTHRNSGSHNFRTLNGRRSFFCVSKKFGSYYKFR